MLSVILVLTGIISLLLPQSDRLLQTVALIPNAVLHEGEAYRLLTYSLFYVSFWHILLNVNLLYFLGLSLETRVSHLYFLLIYIGGGLCGGLAHVFLATPEAAGLGNSTALFTLLGAEFILLYRQRMSLTRGQHLYVGFVSLLIIGGLAAGVVVELINLQLTFQAGNWGHLGGLLFGGLSGWQLSRKKQKVIPKPI